MNSSVLTRGVPFHFPQIFQTHEPYSLRGVYGWGGGEMSRDLHTRAYEVKRASLQLLLCTTGV